MASQNVAPQSTSQKNMSSSQVGSKDGYSVTKRLQKDLATLMMSGDSSLSAFPVGDNLFNWVATITGAKGTVYEGLMYKLTLSFPGRYPYIPPVVKFQTQIYHPNVDEQGNICLDILKEKWSALLDIKSILISIQSLLGEPNIDSPLNTEAAELWSKQDEYKAVLLQKYKEAIKNLS